MSREDAERAETARLERLRKDLEGFLREVILDNPQGFPECLNNLEPSIKAIVQELEKDFKKYGRTEHVAEYIDREEKAQKIRSLSRKSLK